MVVTLHVRLDEIYLHAKFQSSSSKFFFARVARRSVARQVPIALKLGRKLHKTFIYILTKFQLSTTKGAAATTEPHWVTLGPNFARARRASVAREGRSAPIRSAFDSAVKNGQTM